MNHRFTSYEDLPIILNANQVASVLGISRSNAYALMHTDGFPTLRIGKRLLVTKEKLRSWIEGQGPNVVA